MHVNPLEIKCEKNVKFIIAKYQHVKNAKLGKAASNRYVMEKIDKKE
jgi:hypothetical protein